MVYVEYVGKSSIRTGLLLSDVYYFDTSPWALSANKEVSKT